MKKIINHEKYLIDQSGNIYNSVTNHKLKPYGKFCYIKIDNKQYRISDLVGWNFIKYDPNIHYSNKNKDYYDNNVNNLINHNRRGFRKNKNTFIGNQITLIFKNYEIKFNSTSEASLFLNKNPNYLNAYLANNNYSDKLLIRNKFICKLKLDR